MAEKNIPTNDIKNGLWGVPVVIMAGGRGSRLLPYTNILPKPLIPIGGIPIIERIINSLAKCGVEEFFVTVNYKKEMIKSYFNDFNHSYSIKYIEENKPLGTAGSLKLMEGFFREPVIVTNCDILINADYNKIYSHHKKSGNMLTIVSALKKMNIPYGVLNVEENGTVKSIDEKPCHTFYVNTGLYVFEPELFALIPENSSFQMPELIDLLFARNIKVGIYPINEESFLDMGELEEMKRMERKIML